MFTFFTQSTRIYTICLLVLTANTYNISFATEPKTWSKDENGRVLIYRAKPTNWELVCGILGLLGGPVCMSGGIHSFFRPEDNGLMIFCGGIITVCSVYSIWQWHSTHELLFKPLIVIDKHGITYEGKDKILWKKMCRYECIDRTVYHNGNVRHENYLEISTDVDKIQIYEDKIAVTLLMLYKLIDEAYKSYQELEKEREEVVAVVD